jgi:hypothetical protein
MQGWNDFRYFERGLFHRIGRIVDALDAGNVSNGHTGGSCTGGNGLATITTTK